MKNVEKSMNKNKNVDRTTKNEKWNTQNKNLKQKTWNVKWKMKNVETWNQKRDARSKKLKQSMKNVETWNLKRDSMTPHPNETGIDDVTYETGLKIMKPEKISINMAQTRKNKYLEQKHKNVE